MRPIFSYSAMADLLNPLLTRSPIPCVLAAILAGVRCGRFIAGHSSLFLAAGSGGSRSRLQQRVADHGREANVDLRLQCSCLLKKPRTRDATQNANGMVVSVEQCLVGLERKGP